MLGVEDSARQKMNKGCALKGSPPRELTVLSPVSGNLSAEVGLAIKSLPSH